jgi:hypothetical protein
MTQPTGSRSTGISVGSWVFSPNHGESVRILDIEANIEKLIQEVREQAVQEQAGRSLCGDVNLDPALAQQLTNHPLPFRVERMTTAYLRAEGGTVVRD